MEFLQYFIMQNGNVSEILPTRYFRSREATDAL